MLARALFAHAEIDQPIPSSLYTAVAQVLAYVYRLKAALRGEGPMPQTVPEPFVPPELDPLNKKPAAADDIAMNPHARLAARNGWAANGDVLQRAAAPLLVIAILALMVLPIPPWLLDALLHAQHRRRADGDDGRGLHGAAAGLRGLPVRCCC